ncbi:MAG: 4-alpha-glucanotransferase [Lachnospiraceae bacterium]|nr:4-alpha-glucanotransferase [Lachnospiraceae bacterium]
MRKSGILLPVSSLPSKYGIGSFSKEAYRFVDFLEEAGQSYWQILPLGPTGYGDSPYQSFSTFAGNPYFIDLETLVEEGLLTTEDCEAYDFGTTETAVDYEKIYLSRFQVLYKAYENSRIAGQTEFQEFIRKNAYWLEDYALYMAVKKSFDGKSYAEWDEDIKKRVPEVLEAYREKFATEIEFYQFQQYEFAKQWSRLKKYANDRHIEIIGDIPIYVAFDSADTWANPDLFQFDEDCTPVGVAGCPPDAFSATGQLWGNPLYKWEYHKQTGYAWWMKRIAYCYELYDIVRIDHFRGFDEYYAIPFGHPTAEHGAWKTGPGYDIFRTMKEVLGEKKVIAEDLGYLTDSVIELVRGTGYPGMKILQFAFDSREESDYLPHNYIPNSIVYTGTHDNQTTVGWFDSLDAHDKKFAKYYMNISDDMTAKEAVWVFIRAALSSVSSTAVIPMQDYLELGDEARMNTPSTLGDNWKWRMQVQDMDSKLANKIWKLTKTFGRLNSYEFKMQTDQVTI